MVRKFYMQASLLPVEVVAFETISERWIRAALQLKSEAVAQTNPKTLVGLDTKEDA